MVFFFTVTLGASIAGLVLLLALKRFELATGRTLFLFARPGVNSLFQRTVVFIEHVLPMLLRAVARRLWQWIKVALLRTLARAIFIFEHLLERMLHTVREKTQGTRASGEVSPFLREVAEHKKDLQKRSVRERMILDE
jgi:hypothetical protein